MQGKAFEVCVRLTTGYSGEEPEAGKGMDLGVWGGTNTER